VFTIQGSVDVGGQGGCVGTLRFASEAIANELELAGVRRPRSPATVSLMSGTRLSVRSHRRDSTVGQAGLAGHGSVGRHGGRFQFPFLFFLLFFSQIYMMFCKFHISSNIDPNEVILIVFSSI
jgi:hypothetical protein